MSQPEALIFEVSKSSFSTAVIQNSHKVPVIVEFMGVWSEHCIRLEEQLVALAREFPEQFIFAKVDIDEQDELKNEYNIANVPTLKVFQNGEVVQTEEGMMELEELRSLLRHYGVYRESDELREQARQKHMAGETVEAVGLLSQAIKLDPTNTRVAMDMVQIFLDMGEIEQAKSLFERLPEPDQEGDQGRSLRGQLFFRELAAKTIGKQALLDKLAAAPDDHDARFDLAICMVAEHDFKQAVDYLFEILTKQPDYKDGAAKEMIISLTNMLSPNAPELAESFRQRLANILSA